ncbi:hypothetical protein [Streptomyces cinereoruber]
MLDWDVRDTARLLNQTERRFDSDRPVAVLLRERLEWMTGHEAAAVMQALHGRVPGGSVIPSATPPPKRFPA